MGIMDSMMEFMRGRMSKEEKEAMMGGGEGGGGMMDMMSEMMGGGEGEGGRMDMMSIMIPQCLRMMLPDMPQEKRIDFVLEMVTTLMEQGSGGMSEAEKDDFVAQVIEKVKA